MKPLFSRDLTENRKNREQNGEEFLVQAPSLLLTSRLESANASVMETIQRSRLPLALWLLKMLCGGFAALLLAILVLLVVKDGMAGAYAAGAWIFWCAGGCSLAFILLFALEKTVSRRRFGTGTQKIGCSPFPRQPRRSTPS